MAEKKEVYESEEITKLRREIARRKNIEEGRKEMAQREMKKQALKKELKELKFKQSGLGRTITTGKVIFGRIGEGFKRVGQGLAESERRMKASGISTSPFAPVPQQVKVSKTTQKMAQPQPLNVEQMLANIDKQVLGVAGVSSTTAKAVKKKIKKKRMKKRIKRKPQEIKIVIQK